MNRKRIGIIAGIVLVLLLIPLPVALKDGGSVRYQAVLYSVTRVHALSEPQGYRDGLRVELLGKMVYECYDR